MMKMYDQINRRNKFVLLWAVIALMFGGLLLGVSMAQSSQDDPDSAYQRPGFLSPATIKSPRLPGDYPQIGTRTLILFDRSAQTQTFNSPHAQTDIASLADIILVTSDGSKPKVTTGITSFVADTDGSYADAFGLNKPIDKGYPVGYVVVDRQGFIRYRTLDPEYRRLTGEIITILRATP